MKEVSIPPHKKKEIEKTLTEVELLLKQIRKELEKFARQKHVKV
ncbi:MAG TPA: hypothetical protein VLG12_08075 [Candidatus Saccharimonadales bacterium]|nr:hypothetical protein [Candidatus Saccharimonadales bacterium]